MISVSQKLFEKSIDHSRLRCLACDQSNPGIPPFGCLNNITEVSDIATATGGDQKVAISQTRGSFD
jgi:hypothetical protein